MSSLDAKNGTGRGSLDIAAALRMAANDAKTGGRHPVRVTRIVRCAACFATYRTGPGCQSCSDGLTTRDETLRVRVPANVTNGTTLRLAGKGHESTKEESGDLFLTIALPKEPSTPEPEPFVTSEAPPPPKVDRSTKKVALMVGACLLPLAFLWAWRAIEQNEKPKLGAACSRSTDCGSGLCLDLYEENVLSFPGSGGIQTFRGLPRKVGGVCSAECKDDRDCPGSMRCLPAALSERMSNMPDFGLGPGEPNTLACAPSTQPAR